MDYPRGGFFFLPEPESICRNLYVEDVTFPQLRALGEFLSSYGYLLGPESFVDFSELRSGEYLSEVAVQTLAEIIGGWCYFFHF